MNNKKEVLLVESHYRSRPWFLALKPKISPIIFSVLPEERKFFIDNGCDKKKLFYVSSKCSQSYIDKNEIDWKLLKKFEEKVNVKIIDLINADRTIRNCDTNIAYLYAQNIINIIYKIDKLYGVYLVIIEPTFLHELLIAVYMSSCGAKVANPRPDRFLPNKVVFYEGLRFDKIIKLQKNKNAKIIAKEVIENVQTSTPPSFFKENAKRNSITSDKWIKLYRTSLLSFKNGKNKFIQPSLVNLLSKKILSVLRRWFLITFYSKNFIKLTEINEKFIMFPLHVQPEQSIDVAGRPFTDQVAYIKQLAKILPIDINLVVKEHTHALGSRKISFYKEFNKIHNIKLLDPLTNSGDVIQKSIGVVTITGTAWLEAFITKKPYLTAVPCLFSDKDNRFFNP
ncbi:capsular biosynthesis protein, partial [Alphaproteobacteria bacterium]|nr:capsular biosynthesis protein [Alphaproteobacteria bacterium]